MSVFAGSLSSFSLHSISTLLYFFAPTVRGTARTCSSAVCPIAGYRFLYHKSSLPDWSWTQQRLHLRTWITVTRAAQDTGRLSALTILPVTTSPCAAADRGEFLCSLCKSCFLFHLNNLGFGPAQSLSAQLCVVALTMDSCALFISTSCGDLTTCGGVFAQIWTEDCKGVETLGFIVVCHSVALGLKRLLVSMKPLFQRAQSGVTPQCLSQTPTCVHHDSLSVLYMLFQSRANLYFQPLLPVCRSQFLQEAEHLPRVVWKMYVFYLSYMSHPHIWTVLIERKVQNDKREGAGGRGYTAASLCSAVKHKCFSGSCCKEQRQTPSCDELICLLFHLNQIHLPQLRFYCVSSFFNSCCRAKSNNTTNGRKSVFH